MCECWYKEVCESYGENCDRVCVRYAEMKYLMESSNLPVFRRRPQILSPEPCDLKAYIRLDDIKQDIVNFVEQGRNLYICSKTTGNGKAQPLTAEILAENGFITMRDIAVGDRIFGDDGNLHRVVGKFDRGARNVYRVSFRDGTSTLCCDEHLWTVFDRSTRKWKTVELKELLQTGLMLGSRLRYTIPVCKALAFSEAEVSLHPYVLGALLGDGTFDVNGVSFTNSETDVVRNVAQYLPEMCFLRRVSTERDNEYCVADSNCAFVHGRNVVRNRVKDALREYKLLGKHSNEKLIPKQYLYNSIPNRILLLQGLIDTDGYINPNSNTVSYCTTSERLANDFKFLVQSLGGTVRITEKHPTYTHNGEKRVGRTAYTCWCKFPSDLIPFTSAKHRASYAFSQQVEPYRVITAIDFVGKMDCACIKTDNPSELYLTNDCIVTHNTSWAIKLMLKYFDEIWYGNGFRQRALFIHVPTFLAKCKDFNTVDEDFELLKRRVQEVDLVVWDDIGGMDMSSYDYTNLLVAIDAREANGKANIVTGNNVTAKELTKVVGQKIASRLFGKGCEIIEFKGGDRR